MDHGECIEALIQHGAPDSLVSVIRSFLTGRTMSVKIGKTFSAPREVNGGSPQGSILGTFLFNMTTDHLERSIQYGSDGVCLDEGLLGEGCPSPRTPEHRVTIDTGLARIVTDRPSEYGLDNICVVAGEEELCVPFERNGEERADGGSPCSPDPSSPCLLYTSPSPRD